MSVNGIENSASPVKPQTKGNAGVFLGAVASNVLLCAGLDTAFAAVSKVHEDEFVSIGSNLEKVTAGIKNKEQMNDELRAMFKSEKSEDLIKLVKSAKIKNAVKRGASAGVFFGVLFGAFDVFRNAKHAKTQANE